MRGLVPWRQKRENPRRADRRVGSWYGEGGFGACEEATGFAVATESSLNHVQGQSWTWGLTVPVFESGEVVADELFIKTWGGTAWTVVIGRPKSAAVGREKLVDEKEFFFVVEAEFKFGIGQNNSHLGAVDLGSLVEGKATMANFLEKIWAQFFFGFGISQGEVVACLGFSGGSEDGVGKR